jgi:hypothetical protein
LFWLRDIPSLDMTTSCKIHKGVSSARSDDTKSLKGVILDWIILDGQHLEPPLARNVKSNRGFNHDRTGYLLCPAGLDWADHEYERFEFLTLHHGN